MTRILVANMDSFMSENVHFLRITNDHRQSQLMIYYAVTIKEQAQSYTGVVS